jgi:uncharacterized protein YbcI
MQGREEVTDTRGGELRKGISNAMASIMHRFYGKGPSRARTYVFDDFVFCLLDEPFTTVERDLIAGGRADLVRQLRLLFEDIMTRAISEEVEKLTGRVVIGYHSQVIVDPPTAVELFVLGDARTNETAGSDAPGDVGDVDELPTGALGGDRHGSDSQGAISDAVNRLTVELWGKGAARATTYLADEYVFCALESPLTTVERTLVDAGQTLAVRHVRLAHMELRQDLFTAEVERLTGRPVLAAHAQIVFRPDVVFQWYVLGDA